MPMKQVIGSVLLDLSATEFKWIVNPWMIRHTGKDRIFHPIQPGGVRPEIGAGWESEASDQSKSGV
jgi:hypothetical protein